MKKGYPATSVLLALVVVLFGASFSNLVAASSDPEQLNGAWRVTLRETDGVELVFRMTFALMNKQPVRWEAYSREGAARQFVGGGTALLGRLLGKMPPHEALIYIGEGSAEQDGALLTLRGSLESPFLGKRNFVGVIENETMHADLMRGSPAVKAGTIEATRDNSTETVREYNGLAGTIEQTIRSNVFDPPILQRPEFKKFFSQLSSQIAKARDDLDVVAAFQALKPSLKVSHFDFIRNPTLASRSLDQVVSGDKDANPDSYVRLGLAIPQVAILRVTKWDRVSPAINRAFDQISKSNVRVLILDIRGNQGGDATSMAPLAHLITEPITVGTFIGRKWFDSHRNPPAGQELSTLPTLGSYTQPLEMMNQLREHGGLVGKVLPQQPHFDGPVYLLVDRASASASEPLAHALLTTRRATLIGERTAGKMLMALPHALTDGWVVIVPEADFIAADGSRLEGRGVEPQVQTSPNDVYIAAADQMASFLPYSAAIIRAQSSESLKRLQDAEKAYRSALKVSDQQQPAAPSSSVAFVHKRLAIILSARGDVAGSRVEYREVLKLVPDDADALKALRDKN